MVHAQPRSVDPACDLCGRAEALTVLRGTDHREGLGGVFEVAECTTCGLARTAPRPADLGSWYPDSYPQHAGDEELTVRVVQAALREGASGRLPGWARALTARVVPDGDLGGTVPPAGRVLDVGAGNGAAVAALRSVGVDAWGVEPSARAVAAAARAGRVTVREGTLEANPLDGERWTVVRFNHVLEHVPSPVGALRLARASLEDGGRVVVTVPNLGSAGARLFGASWDGLELPRHLHHFTRRTLARTIAAAGLEVVSMRTAAVFGVLSGSLDARTSGGSRQRGWGGSLLARCLAYPVELLLAALGAGDALVAVARPRS
jgi:SAM-dependent methyltransferase